MCSGEVEYVAFGLKGCSKTPSWEGVCNDSENGLMRV